MSNVRVIIGSGGAAAWVVQEQLPDPGSVSRPPGSRAKDPLPVPLSVSRPPGGVTAHTTYGPEHEKYPLNILDILCNNWYAKILQGRANTLGRVVPLKVGVSDVKTVGGLPLERWESSQRGFPTRPLESEVGKSYPYLHWYAISRVGSRLVKSKKDDANFGQEKKREALRDRI